MQHRFWQAPPEPGPEASAGTNDDLLRLVMHMNPQLGNGGSLQQVKAALARRSQGAAAMTPAGPVGDHDMVAMIDGFARSKAVALTTRLEQIAKARAALEAEEAAARAAIGRELLVFLGMLDADLLRRCGRAVLKQHASFLQSVGLSVVECLPDSSPSRSHTKHS